MKSKEEMKKRSWLVCHALWHVYDVWHTTRAKRSYNEWFLSRKGIRRGFCLRNLRDSEEAERRTTTSRIEQSWETVALNCRAPFLDTYCAPPPLLHAAREGGFCDRGSRGSKGGCIRVHIEIHPRDVSELSANRTSAFHRRHHLPRCDVHSKEKGGARVW